MSEREGLRSIVYLDDLAKYRDRLLMFREAAEQLGHVHLLTRVLPVGWQLADLCTDRFTLVPLAPRRIPRLELAWRIQREVAAIVDRHPVRILHDTAGFLTPLFARERLRPARGRVLLTSSFAALYDWRGEVQRRWPYRWQRFLRARWKVLWQERLLTLLADAFTLFGEGHVAPFARMYGLSPGRVFSLPNCVDPASFGPVPPTPGATGFGPGDQVLLFTGAIFRHKGCFELVSAFGRLAARHPRARLLLVGWPHPGEHRLLLQRIAGLGLVDRVRIQPEIPRQQLPGLMAGCHAFVFPSYNEGSPRSVIEAMACGLPIVGTRIPGILTLDPTEQFIGFVERADTDGLTAALDRLLADPAESRRRGELARARFLAHHTPAAAGRALVALYEQLDELGPAGLAGR